MNLQRIDALRLYEATGGIFGKLLEFSHIFPEILLNCLNFFCFAPFVVDAASKNKLGGNLEMRTRRKWFCRFIFEIRSDSSEKCSWLIHLEQEEMTQIRLLSN